MAAIVWERRVGMGGERIGVGGGGVGTSVEAAD